ncbi:MAG: hypothetical protein AB8B64_14580 [Granulosicoccus sp.]
MKVYAYLPIVLLAITYTAESADDISQELSVNNMASVTQQNAWELIDTRKLKDIDDRGLLDAKYSSIWNSAVQGVTNFDDQFLGSPAQVNAFHTFVSNASPNDLHIADMMSEANTSIEKRRGMSPHKDYWLNTDNTRVYANNSGDIQELKLVTGNSIVEANGNISPAIDPQVSSDHSFVVWSLTSFPAQVPVDWYGGEGTLDWGSRWEEESYYRRGPWCQGSPTECPNGNNYGLYTQIKSWWIVVPVLESADQNDSKDYSIAYVDSVMESFGAGTGYNWAQQGVKSNNPNAVFTEVSPRQDYNGSCQTGQISATVPFTSIGVKRNVQQCETWNVDGATSARGWFSVTYLDSHQKGTRSLAQAIVIKYPEGGSAQPAIGHGIGYKCNAPGPDFIFGGCAL